MAGIYNLLDNISSDGASIRDGVSGSPLSGWSIAWTSVTGTVLKTNTTVAVERNNRLMFSPYPWLKSSTGDSLLFDLSAISTAGSQARLKFYGRVSKDAAIGGVKMGDIWLDKERFIDEGTHWKFESEWGSDIYDIFDPSAVPFTLTFEVLGTSDVGYAAISNLEASISIDIEITDSPPPSSLTLEGEWNQIYLSTGSECSTEVALVDVNVTSVTAYGYSDYSEGYSRGNCTTIGMTYLSDPVWEIELDPMDIHKEVNEYYFVLRVSDFDPPPREDILEIRLVYTAEITTTAGVFSTTFEGYTDAGGSYG